MWFYGYFLPFTSVVFGVPIWISFMPKNVFRGAQTMKHLNVELDLILWHRLDTHQNSVFFLIFRNFGIHYLWNVSLPLIIMGIGHRHSAQDFNSDLKGLGNALQTYYSMEINIICTPEIHTFQKKFQKCFELHLFSGFGLDQHHLSHPAHYTF